MRTYRFLLGISLIAGSSVLASAAMAQSTGSQELDEIIVTGTTGAKGVAGVVIPDSPKSRSVLSHDFIERQVPGQTILNTINMIPGVNFTNSDAYGASGGNLRIRGFDGNRISLTMDGTPLNDTGNYAAYSNQQLDPEIIEQVNVNLGSTDVDSPTASSSGGTVNYRTIIPTDAFGAVLQPSMGDDSYFRVFGMVNTGVLNSIGTKAFFSASRTSYDKFKGPGGLSKQQVNARIYQPIGDNGDFISLSGHYNKNRNNFYRNLTLAQYQSDPTLDNDASCVRLTPVAGAVQNDGTGAAGACSNYYNLRINPSNTGNVRINSRFTLADGIILTVDPSYQYTLANGGGSTVLSEKSPMLIGSSGKAGVDLNGDGDVLDSVRVYTPNNTNTNRYGVTASMIWDVNPTNRVRIAYTYDRGNHRQTGEYGFLSSIGDPLDPFGGRNGPAVIGADGNVLQQRDRKSIALLNQISGEYRGKFLDEKLTVQIGVRAPFFKRDLDQNCYTIKSSGFANCTTQPISTLNIISPTNPNGTLYLPFKATYKYNKVLPNIGMNYNIGAGSSIYASYAKGLSSPRTDNLYRAPIVDVQPETTDSFDLGYRYQTGRIQAQVAGWYIKYQNRIVQSYDQELGISIDRNIGKVDTYGIDAQLSVRPIDPLTLYAFGSYLHSEVKDDIVLSGSSTIATAGKKVAETPEWQFGGRAQVDLGPVSVGAQGKYVGKRFATDLNDVQVPSYVLVDLDARVSLAPFGLDKTFFQLNVVNLFDKKYLGNISTQIASAANGGTNPTFAVGAPRTVMGTLRFGF